MALIKRQILVCNRCGKEELDGRPNVSVLDEAFYLCDACLGGLLDYITDNTKVLADECTIAEPDDNDYYETYAVVPEPDKETVYQPLFREKYQHKYSTNLKWDDVNVDKVLTMVETGRTNEYIAKSMGTTVPSIDNILGRIRHAKAGSDLYPYKARLLAIKRMRGREKGRDE